MEWLRPGVIVPLVTPVTTGGLVPEVDLDRLIGRVADDVVALIPGLSTGEGWALDDQQWVAAVAHTVAHARGLPVLAGVQRPGTAEIVARAARAVALGATAVVVPTPSGPEITQDEMYDHYVAVTSAIPAPVIVYHESMVSGNLLDPATLARVSALDQVVAVKDSAGDPEATRALLATSPPVGVWQGHEHLVEHTPGVDGYVLALANLEPRLCARHFAGHADPAELDAACARYRLTEPDWYRHVKAHLCRQGVLSSAATVEES
ncbi:dihydrodipicolinate synthase family protein [Actinokineospora diospyrosa]|uniref:4-hydroxy-tetrahydrodipicolinate synthase n=1 Tax=Actinokineospora diospyrosa TaxID=103728 RepID=A0ABT1I5D2_9PSEU|nr:dihydrodipicolinate synthase family protein [Actinokineospora diospyrosa]MCP2267839.1 4-hydroxy-tetrahydrodipicolinate synthase [Actinokineospora diospyrosa]